MSPKANAAVGLTTCGHVRGLEVRERRSARGRKFLFTVASGFVNYELQILTMRRTQCQFEHLVLSSSLRGGLHASLLLKLVEGYEETEAYQLIITLSVMG